MQPSRTNKISWFLPWAVVVGLFLACFSGVIFQDRLFAFRDASHFYYPLFSYIQQTWASGQLPWWNPYENGGMPIAANPAASLFYPGKIVFFLIPNFDIAYRVYILAHVLLAAWGAYRLARYWHASQPAATLASITYTFSGAVLIQYSNVIFLVGAAWLPIGVLLADRMLRHRRRRDAVWLGVVCAIVTLGGDPQTAYHLGLLVLLLIVIRALRRRVLVKQLHTSNFTLQTSRSAGASPAAKGGSVWKLLVITLLTGFALAAVQIIPTVQYLVTTDRSDGEVARSLYEVPKVLGEDDASRRVADGLLCRTLDQPGHLQSVYEFSVGPWRWAELVWPNCFGRQFPLHRRWIQALPGEGRVWTPTLYAGIIPLGFAIGAFQLRRRKRGGVVALSRRWMSWTLLLGLLGSLGYYGVVWGVEEFIGPTSAVGAPVGGLYWLMTVALPGYVYFRYPAKLLVLVSLGLAILAARGWDDYFAGRQQRTRRFFGGVALLSIAVLIGFTLARSAWSSWVATTASCPIFGPLDVTGAFYDTVAGLLQTTIFAGAAWFLLRIGIVSGGARPRVFWKNYCVNHEEKHAGTSPAANRRIGFVLLVLAAFDLGMANHWIVATAPAELWRTPPVIAAKEGEPILQVYRWPRLYDPQWKEHGSPDRLAEEVRWNCLTLYPKYNLLHRVGVVNSYGTMMSAEHRALLRGALVEVMRATGATMAILPRDAVLPDGQRVELDTDSAFSVWTISEN